MFYIGNPQFIAIDFVFFGHFQLFGCYKMECRVEMRHGHEQRVYRATVFQVADHGDIEIFESALCFVDGVEVEHRLRGVLVRAVPGVDDRLGRYLRGISGGTVEIVPHDDEVDIVTYHNDGVFQCLSFGGTGRRCVGKTDNAASQTVYGGFETQSCTGRRFKEQGGDPFAIQDMSIGVFLKEFGCFQHFQNFFFGIIGNRY